MISDTIKTMEKNRKDKKQLLANFHRLYSNFKSLSTDEFELEMAISLCVDHGQYSYRYLKLEISDSCNKCWARAYWDSPQSLTIFPRDCQSYNRDQESWSNFLDLVVEFLISEWGIEEIILNPKIYLVQKNKKQRFSKKANHRIRITSLTFCDYDGKEIDIDKAAEVFSR